MSLGPDDHGRWLRGRFQPSPGEGVPPKPERDRLRRVSNERTKLTAAFLNAIAIGFVVLGFVRPYLEGATANALFDAAGSVAIGVGAHFAARWWLGLLRTEKEE